MTFDRRVTVLALSVLVLALTVAGTAACIALVALLRFQTLT